VTTPVESGNVGLHSASSQTFEGKNMNRNEFIKKQRGGIRGLLFPHSINRLELLIRCAILGICVALPLNVISNASLAKVNYLTENPDEAMLTVLCANLAVLLFCLILFVAFAIMSFWILYIPRLRSMGQSPKLSWLMVVPVVNVVFAWFLILAPPK